MPGGDGGAGAGAPRGGREEPGAAGAAERDRELRTAALVFGLLFACVLLGMLLLGLSAYVDWHP
jgi:hypothetical protein